MKTITLLIQRICLTLLTAGLFLPFAGAAQSVASELSITSPTNGATFSLPANIAITAQLNAPAGPDSYVLFTARLPGGPVQLLGYVTNSPSANPGGGVYIFDWTNAPAGDWTLDATAMDTNGVRATSPPVEIYVGMAPPPAIAIVTPTPGEAFTAPTNVEIDASVDDTNVTSVNFTAQEFYTGGPIPALLLELGSVSNWVSLNPPRRDFIFVWTNTPVGNWIVGAAGNGSTFPTTNASVEFKVTAAKASSVGVQLVSPANGTVYPRPQPIELIADVEGSNDVAARVIFYDNSNYIGAVSNFVVVDPLGPIGVQQPTRAALFEWTNAAPGSHTLTAQATDTNGMTFASAPVMILIDGTNVVTNSAPLVRITSPPNNSIFRAPVNIPLTAFAVDTGGAIASVEFFAGSNSLGFARVLTNLPPPILNPYNVLPVPRATDAYQLIWSNAPVGSYTVTALATDSNGVAATSLPIDLKVLPGPVPPTNLPTVVTIVATDPIAVSGTNCWPWLGGPLTWSNWVSPVAVWQWNTNCGPNDATFVVNRSGATNDPLTIDYAIGGTATNGVAYMALPGSVTIPAGQSSASITVVPLDDTNSPFASTVILSLDPSTNGTGGYLLGVPRAAEAIIINEPGPASAAATLLPDRSFHLCLPGPDGAWFRIDASTNLLDWTSLCTNQVVNGLIDFIDPAAAGSSGRMYRAVALP